MRTALLTIFLATLVSPCTAQVVPAPKRFSSQPWKQKSVGAARGIHTICCADASLRPQVQVLIDALSRLGVEQASFADDAPLRFKLGTLDASDSYSIEPVDTTLQVTVESSEGAAQAVSTLLQLVTVNAGKAMWPALRINDGPDHSFRCFMVDMGRNPHSPSTLRQVVDMLAFYKVNLLQLHLADDQLFSWPSRAYPKLKSDRAGWSWEEFEALEAYSQARGVTIIPELDVPGHSTILRRAYPDVFGKTTTDLATSATAQKGVETLLIEMMSVFKASPYVHVGGDEAYGVPEQAQRDFINRLHRFLKSHHRRCVVWEGPQLGQGDNKVDTEVLQINWRTINFPAQAMLDAGYQVVNAAWDPLYIVDHYPRTMFTAVDLQRCYRWNPLRFAHVNPGIPTFAQPHFATPREKLGEGILGFCMPWWEGRQENLIPLCLPRLAAVASAAWNRSGENDFQGFQRRQGAALKRLGELSAIHLPPLPVANAESERGNHAFLGKVTVTEGAHQPHFGPQRLTNGIDSRFDHFLGYATTPTPLDILIELSQPSDVARVVIHETAVGESHEIYELFVSETGDRYESVGSSQKGTRRDKSFVEHTFTTRPVRYLKVRTRGCHGLTFPSFSRLTEIRAFSQ